MEICGIFAVILVEFHEAAPVSLTVNTGNLGCRNPFMIDLTVKVMLFVGAMHRRSRLVHHLLRYNKYSLLKIPRVVGYLWLTSGL